ncbi:MAG: hypothetical protein JO261_00025 [Alphaproteobacteria bacterium]|nr:hypothetical protein [Alphaproteobacteria bacterium]MBV9692060.1 hypothetical protein [Alphaproteobacteria bacterium]
MPRFFFHLASPGEYSRDDTGTEFATFYDAYLDAHRAAADMSCDLLSQSADPNRYSFVISDGEGHTLAELPFVGASRRGDSSGREIRARIARSMADARRLRAEVKAESCKAHAALAEIRALLARPATSAF